MNKTLFLVFIFSINYNLEIKAQSFTLRSIQDMIQTPVKDVEVILKQSGFKKVYGGPKKEGGYLFLWNNKQKNEYLFEDVSDSMIVEAFHYYLPLKSQYLKMLADKNTMLNNERCSFLGSTLYTNGKKYYQVYFWKE